VLPRDADWYAETRELQKGFVTHPPEALRA
jgi:hypothetical protein